MEFGVDVLSIIINFLPQRDCLNFSQCSKSAKTVVLDYRQFLAVSPETHNSHLLKYKRVQILHFCTNRKYRPILYVSDEGISHLPITDLRFFCCADGVTSNSVKRFYLKNLEVGPSSKITEESFESSTSLQELYCGSGHITDEPIQNLPIKVLFVDRCLKLTNNGIKNLPLTKLSLGTNRNIDDEGIKNLKLLTSLDCGRNDNITDEGIKHLPLKELTCYRKITHDCIKNFPLTKLSCRYNTTITDETLRHLPLTSLSCGRRTQNITDECLKFLQLTELDCDFNSQFTDEGLKHQTNLIILKCGTSSTFGDESLKFLTKLTELDINKNENITDEGIRNLTNLTRLKYYSYSKITKEGISKLKSLKDIPILDPIFE